MVTECQSHDNFIVPECTLNVKRNYFWAAAVYWLAAELDFGGRDSFSITFCAFSLVLIHQAIDCIVTLAWHCVFS